MTTVSARTARPTVLATVGIGLAAVLGVAAIGRLIVATPAWSVGELKVVAAVGAAHNPLLDALCQLIDGLFGPTGAILLGVLLLAWALLLTGTWRGALRAGVLLAVPWAAAEGMKLVVRRVRPEPTGLTRLLLPDPVTFSFPSGHTAFATALVCALALSIASLRARRAAAVAGAVLVVAVAWSRVYLGVHYPTDVVAAVIVVVAIAIPLNAVMTRVGPLRTPAVSASRTTGR